MFQRPKSEPSQRQDIKGEVKTFRFADDTPQDYEHLLDTYQAQYGH